VSDDYLFDPQSKPDPKIERLERALKKHRWVPEPLALGDEERVPTSVEAGTRPVPRPAGSGRWWIVGLAAAAAVVAAVLLLRKTPVAPHDSAAPYLVEGLEGVPSVKTGDELTTGVDQTARVTIGSIGHLDVEPNSTLRVVSVTADKHDLYLERGGVHARILSQPRVFQIGTPAGKSIDLGCEYALDVDDAGQSHLSVRTGQVAFEFDGREVYVPAHASCTSVPGRGPSAPVRDDASDAFKDALEAVEFAKDPPYEQVAALLKVAEREDTLTLWHLYDSERTAKTLRDEAFGRLESTFPMPAGVTREGLARNDRAMHKAWLESMKPEWRTGW
jgi:hypothetical protein